MTGQGGRICKDYVVTDRTVMSYVDSCHQEVSAADSRLSPSPGSTSIQSDKLSNLVIVPNLQSRGRSVILQILRVGPDSGMSVELVIPANNCRAFDQCARPNKATGANRHLVTDDGVRANRHPFSDNGGRRHNRSWMYLDRRG